MQLNSLRLTLQSELQVKGKEKTLNNQKNLQKKKNQNFNNNNKNNNQPKPDQNFLVKHFLSKIKEQSGIKNIHKGKSKRSKSRFK